MVHSGDWTVKEAVDFAAECYRVLGREIPNVGFEPLQNKVKKS